MRTFLNRCSARRQQPGQTAVIVGVVFFFVIMAILSGVTMLTLRWNQSTNLKEGLAMAARSAVSRYTYSQFAQDTVSLPACPAPTSCPVADEARRISSLI